MKSIILVMLICVSFTELLAEYYDEPYKFKKDVLVPLNIETDSTGTPFFASTNKYAVGNAEDKSFEIVDSIRIGDEIYYFKQNGFGFDSQFLRFGKKMTMMSFYSNTDTSFLCFLNQDTGLIFRNRSFSSNIWQVFNNTYSNGKFWFGGLWGYLYRFDENTYQLDSIRVDSVKLFQWKISFRKFAPYKQGILYVSQYDNNLHYYSDEEQWFANIDSLAKWSHVSFMEYHEGKVLLSTYNNEIYLYDIEQKTMEEIDLAQTIIAEDYKNKRNHLGNLELSPIAIFDCKGNIYINLTFDGDATLYKIKEDRTAEEYKIPGFTRVWDVTRSGRNSNWFRGYYGNYNDSDAAYKVVEHFPDGTGLEGAPPTLLPINVYPNPSKTYTNVKFYLQPSTKASLKCSIYNYMGSLIAELDNEIEYDETTGFATKRIETGSLNTGIYYLLVDNGSEKRLFGFAVE